MICKSHNGVSYFCAHTQDWYHNYVPENKKHAEKGLSTVISLCFTSRACDSVAPEVPCL